MALLFRVVLKALGYLWALPITLLGLLLGFIALITGGRAQCVRGAVEFWGGFARWFLKHHPFCRDASAMTLGHVILGQTPQCLEYSRDHEHVHVRQFERWGLFMAPAYIGSSVWAWMRGKHFYWDNAFEKQAYREAP
jgi:hypothetical protein